MPHYQKWKKKRPNLVKQSSKWVGGAFTILIILFIGIGFLTGAKTTYRIYSDTIQGWTTQLKGSSFIYLFEMENRMFTGAHPEGENFPGLSTLSFQLLTSLTPNDPRSLLGREIPGLSSYNSDIIIAGEGTDYTTIPIESRAPIDVVQKDREAVGSEEKKPNQDENKPQIIKNKKVFIYSTHNRESFLPQLPKGTTINEAYSGKVNVSLISQRLAEDLEKNGIGAEVDHTDISKVLKEKGMEYYESYDASRPVVKEAMSREDSLQYFFDIHRDSLGREYTTTTIDGKNYARVVFVIGADNKNYEKNLKIASDLHKRIEKKYPGLSRGVITKKGSGVDGIYNQDLSQHSLLFEVGGLGNNLDELYRTADILAGIFSDYYFDSEKVSKNS